MHKSDNLPKENSLVKSFASGKHDINSYWFQEHLQRFSQGLYTKINKLIFDLVKLVNIKVTGRGIAVQNH